jgi:hypothetical protein
MATPKIIESYIQAKNAYDMPASLAIEINPIDTHGSITKKKGVVITSSSELDEIGRLLSHLKVGELSKKIDEVNPKRDASTLTGKGGRDIFKI